MITITVTANNQTEGIQIKGDVEAGINQHAPSPTDVAGLIRDWLYGIVTRKVNAILDDDGRTKSISRYRRRSPKHTEQNHGNTRRSYCRRIVS